ncbi:MAG: cytochrome c family protein [Rhodospirillales bacterium]
MHFSFLEKFGASVLIVMWLVWGTNVIGNVTVHAEAPKKPAIEIAGLPAEGAGEAADSKPAEPEDALTLLAKADAQAGAKVFNKCKACHTTEKGGPNRVGPNLWNVVGNKIATHEGYSYSGALKEKGGEWTYKNLDAFIASPRAFAKGTKMTFAGVKKASERAAVIVYLRSLSDSPKPLP